MKFEGSILAGWLWLTAISSGAAPAALPATLPEGIPTNPAALWPTATIETGKVQSAREPPDGGFSWSAGRELDAREGGRAKVPLRFMVGDPEVPAGMVSIPESGFLPGRGVISAADEQAAKAVHVRGFFIDMCEVPGWFWTDVRAWALNHGYSDLAPGQWGAAAGGGAAGQDHPVVLITWYDSLKWCNARSEMEGLVPVYYTDDSQGKVYRSGVFDISAALMDQDATGYKLPTELEWEMAARGGAIATAFPWGDTLEPAFANYMNSGDAFDNGTTPITFFCGKQTIQGKPSLRDAMNGYGLMDVAGNVYEWCWERFLPELPQDPGDRMRQQRVIRGGCWRSVSDAKLSCVYRNGMNAMGSSDCIGLRCVRRR